MYMPHLQSRRVHDIILLEACIENTSRSPMVLDYLRFDPHPQMSAIEICTDPPDPGKGSPGQHLADYIQNLKVNSLQKPPPVAVLAECLLSSMTRDESSVLRL